MPEMSVREDGDSLVEGSWSHKPRQSNSTSTARQPLTQRGSNFGSHPSRAGRGGRAPKPARGQSHTPSRASQPAARGTQTAPRGSSAMRTRGPARATPRRGSIATSRGRARTTQRGGRILVGNGVAETALVPELLRPASTRERGTGAQSRVYRGQVGNSAARGRRAVLGASNQQSQGVRVDDRSRAKSVVSNARELWPRVLPVNLSHALEVEDKRVSSDNHIVELPDLRRKPKSSLINAEGIFSIPEDRDIVCNLSEDNPRLDRIRSDHSCCIVTDEVNNRLHVYGISDVTAKKDVSNAIGKLQQLIKHEVSEANKCLRFILAEAPLNDGTAPHVELVGADAPHLASTHAPDLSKPVGYRSVAIVNTSICSDTSSNWPKDAILIRFRNVKCIEWAVEKALDQLSTKVGRIELKALLGAFVFTQHTRGASTASEADICPAKEFWEMIKHALTRGELLRLGPEAQLFERITSIDQVLEGYHSGRLCQLDQVKPTYTGLFTFKPSSERTKQKVDLQLTVEVSEHTDRDGNLTIERRDWSSLFDDPESRRLEAFVLGLDGGIAWKFDLAVHPYREVPAEYRRFSNNIVVGKPSPQEAAPGSTHLMFRFKPIPGMLSFRQRTCWKFFFKNHSHFVLELARNDKFGVRDSANDQAKPIVKLGMQPTETHWEACVYDDRWEEQLASIDNSKANNRATSCEAVTALFPPDWNADKTSRAPGVEVFMEAVQKVCNAASAVIPWPGL